jgi:uncharacterized protein
MVKKYIHIILIGFFSLLVNSVNDIAFSQTNFPKPVGFINDFANVIPDDYKSKMEAVSRELEKKTGVEVVVVTIETTGDVDYNEYANRLYEEWGIGKKGVDEGVLILNAVKDRTIRIETGYGVEGILPDGLCGEIRDDYIIPFLKKGEYGQGLSNGLLAIVSVIAKDKGVEISGEMPSDFYPTGKVSKRGLGIGSIITLIILLMLMSRGGLLPLLVFGSLMGHRRDTWGGFGGSGGGFSSGFGGGFGGFGGGLSGGGGAGGSY